MSKLKVLRLNISDSESRNELKIIAIQKIFEFSNNKYLSNLEEFSLKASNSKIEINKELFYVLG